MRLYTAGMDLDVKNLLIVLTVCLLVLTAYAHVASRLAAKRHECDACACADCLADRSW